MNWILVTNIRKCELGHNFRLKIRRAGEVWASEQGSLAQILPLARSGTTDSLLFFLHLSFLSCGMEKVVALLSVGCFEG